MSILVSESSRVLVQGITGREGAFHAQRMREAGTRVVAGVSPGKGGRTQDGVQVFDSVVDAVGATEADVSVIFVPAPLAADAILEASEAGVGLIVCITEGIPVRDMAEAVAQADRRGTAIIGPNCPGVISPGRANVGIMPADVFSQGSVGLVSRSGTLTYLLVDELTRAGIGQSTCIGMGGDAVHGLGYVECLRLFEADPQTQAIVLVGEIGGDDEERAAEHVSRHVAKPVVAYLAGFAAPAGKTMGHAGAIVSGAVGTAASKLRAFEGAGIPVARDPEHLPALVRRVEGA